MSTSTPWQRGSDATQRYELILVPAILGLVGRVLLDRVGLRRSEARRFSISEAEPARRHFSASWVGPAGRVVGVDINPGMLALACSTPGSSGAATKWLEQDAQRLPFDDQTFDAVLCAQATARSRRPRCVA